MSETNPLIAYNGEMELLNASWSLDSGRTVELRLCGDAYSRNHPFKRFQQRRNGRMGTRFHLAVGDCETGEVKFHGEVMLAGWKDSSYSGQSITLWLDDEAERHPFAGYTRRKQGQPGQMLAACLVEISDDEQPIDQARRDRVESATASAAEPGTGASPARPDRPSRPTKRASPRLSSQAHLMVTSKMFVRYLEETRPRPGRVWTPERARIWVKNELQVESLSELDRNPTVVKRFHETIRKRYENWHQQAPP